MNSEAGSCDCPCRRWALDEVAKAEAEVERLRADRDGFKDIARNQRKLIEAALALHKTRMGGPFCPECGQEVGKGGYCTSPTVKALKGEK